MTEKQIVNADAFAQKYTENHARGYYEKHRESWIRRLSTRRELEIARRALRLAGNPGLVLDLPGGVGRFWPLLAEMPERKVIAADSSKNMLEVGLEHCPAAIRQRITTLHTSAYGIDLEDNQVDAVFSMRLLHHIGEADKRREIFREFRRVSREHVILSLWVDGNYKAWRRMRRDQADKQKYPDRFQNRFVFGQQAIEQEFSDVGLSVVGHFDFLPLYAMLRLYVLKKL